MSKISSKVNPSDYDFGKLPPDWEAKTVGELVDEQILEKPLDGNHGEIHPKHTDFVSSGIPFIMATDIKNGKIDFERCKYITIELANTLRKGFAKEGDVLLTHKASMGRTAIVEKTEHPFLMLTPQVTYYRIKNRERLSSYFLMQYFNLKFPVSLLRGRRIENCGSPEGAVLPLVKGGVQYPDRAVGVRRD